MDKKKELAKAKAKELLGYAEEQAMLEKLEAEAKELIEYAEKQLKQN